MTTDRSSAGKNQALIIDDTPIIRSLLSEALCEKGYEVRTAPDGLSGLEMATQLRPQVIFCDTYMPDLDGFETMRRLREALPDAVLVMTNSLPQTSKEQAMAEASVDYVLNKPFGLDELWTVLEEIKGKLLSPKFSSRT